MSPQPRTVADLIEALTTADPGTRIAWHADGPIECCPGHVHDVTLLCDNDVDVDVRPGLVTITLSGGEP